MNNSIREYLTFLLGVAAVVVTVQTAADLAGINFLEVVPGSAVAGGRGGSAPTCDLDTGGSNASGGACCSSTGACHDGLSSSGCANIGGAYCLSSNCSTGVCDEPTGACCSGVSEGECIDDVSEIFCSLNQSGSFQLGANCSVASCASSCGDGFTDPGEACDDGGLNGAGLRYCNADCSRIDSGLCGEVPDTGCGQAQLGKSRLSVREGRKNARDRFLWRFTHGDATAGEAFGDPLTLDPEMTFCVYDTSSASQPVLATEIPSAGECGESSCWKVRGDRFHGPTLRYKKKDGLPFGVSEARLNPQSSDRTRIQIKGRGADVAFPMGLPLPALPFSLPATAQFVVDNGASRHCWQVVYDDPFRNTATVFDSRGPSPATPAR